MKRKIPDEVRALVYQRDGGRCQYGGCELSRANGDVMNLHHIKPEQFGGTEEPSNLITLCDIHHKSMHVEFHAFYPDSRGIIMKMNHLLKLYKSKFYGKFKIDDGYDLSKYLEFLTGKKEFREGQLKVIRAALSGRDVLFVTPTGSGKSVCYQLPGIVADEPVLVISPLKALMKDQATSIWRRKVSATYINGDLSDSEKRQRLEFIKQRLFKFIFVAPERFFKSKDPNNAALYQKYGYLVVDEAHAIDSWGKAFRPSYSKIGELRSRIKSPPVIALTASAPLSTQRAIISSLNMTNPYVVVTGFYRENIEIRKMLFGANLNVKGLYTKQQYVIDLLATSLGEKKLIFAATVKEGESILSFIKSAGYDAAFYHGKLDTKTKMDIQNRFDATVLPALNILVATSAFGMGIDIPDIRHIVHFRPALSIEDYYQQIGRAGRDRKHSVAHLLYQDGDERTLEYLAKSATEGSKFKEDHNYTDDEVAQVKSSIQQSLGQMLEILSVEDGKEWNYILNYFGQKPPTFWDRHGARITKLIFFITNTVTIICVILLLIGFIGRFVLGIQ